MAGRELFRGRVTAYPQERDKGLVAVAVGGLDKDGDTVYAQVEQSISGAYWLPEIGDVVDVELSGLTGRRARIVHIHRGEGDGQTAECWTQDNDVKQLCTRSGHTVTLIDTQDHTAITIQTAGGLELALRDETQTVALKGAEQGEPMLLLDLKNDEVRLAAGKKLSISCGGASIAIDSGGNISIATDGNLSLAAQKIDMDAKGALTAAGQQVELNGSMGAKVVGDSRLELTSSGVTQVKGGMVQLN